MAKNVKVTLVRIMQDALICSMATHVDLARLISLVDTVREVGSYCSFVKHVDTFRLPEARVRHLANDSLVMFPFFERFY